jgi:hypothetical protein
VTVDLLAEMAAINPFDFLVDEAAVDWPFAYEASLASELRPCLEPLPGTPPLDAYLRQIEAWGPTTVELVTGLNRALARDIAYRTRMEEGVQAPEETLGRRSGSCRDSGWLLVQLLRLCGLAARFVSGYLVQLGSDAASADGSDEASADCADLHAWTAFRFPVLGEIERSAVSLELRRALEPWLVLGERSGPGGTTLPVDYSLERLQVLARMPGGKRYAVSCNGYLVPLAATGVAGARVAGVRFRAWRTADGLHPTIPPHAPLTIDIVDTWSGRSIGGRRWHVAPPDGCSPQALPIDAREAEARRRALFETIGHSPAGTPIEAAGEHPDFPLTPRFAPRGARAPRAEPRRRPDTRAPAGTAMARSLTSADRRKCANS